MFDEPEAFSKTYCDFPMVVYLEAGCKDGIGYKDFGRDFKVGPESCFVGA